MSTRDKQPTAAGHSIAKTLDAENPYLQFIDNANNNDSDNPYLQFIDASNEIDSDNPYLQFVKEEKAIQEAIKFTERLSHVEGIQEQPEWMIEHMAKKPSRLNSYSADETGFLNNAVRGAGERAADLGGGLLNAATAAVESAPQGGFAPGYVGQFVSAEQDARNKKLASDALADGADTLRATDFGYDEKRNTLEGAKAKFGAGKYFGAAAELIAAGNESMITSGPDMVGAVGALPVYVAARTGEIANERAKNKGLDRPTQTEINEAAPVALASSLLERILPGRVLRGAGEVSEQTAKEISDGAIRYVMKKAASETGKSALIEGGTEFVQEGIIEYIGQRYGTNAAMDANEAIAQGVEAAILGAIGGGTIGVAKGAYDGVSDVRRAPLINHGEVDQPKNGEQLLSGSEDLPPDEPSNADATTQYEPNNQSPVTVEDTHASGSQPAHDAFAGIAQYAAQQRAEAEAARLREQEQLEEAGLAGAARAYGIKQGYISKSPDELEAELTGDTDIDLELRALMAELDQAETIAREASPMVPEEVNPFDQFDNHPRQPEGLFDGIRQAQTAQQEASRAQQIANQEMAGANFQEDDQRGFMGGPARLAEQSRFEPVKQKVDISELSEVYPPNTQTDIPAEIGGSVEEPIQPAPEQRISTTREGRQNLPVQETATSLEPNLVDIAAVQAATSPENNLPEPTDAQKEAGNYKKAHVKVHGLDIAIENPRGSTRSGTDKEGKPWSVTMHNHYGYIKRTEGADGDHVDVFIGPNPKSDKVFIVDQVNVDGSFDEAKVLIGFDSKLKARSGYKSNYSSGWKVGPITSMSMDEFKEWVKSGDTTKPLSPTLSVKANVASAAALDDKKRLNSESKSQISESNTQKSESDLPPILTQSRKQFITGMAKERGLKKDSPGYAGALKQVEADYELELDRAHANLSFDEFNRLNSDSPESVNRQAWESLREEYGTDDTRYSIGDSGGISVKSAQSVVDGIRKSWKNPHIKIATVANIDAMPEPVRARIQADQVPNEKVKAVFHNGSVYVNASTMRDAADVERAVFHEVHGHYGTRLLFGRETSTAMGRLYLAIGGAKGIRDIAKKHNIDLSKYEEILKGESPAKRAEVMADELLAHIAQDSKPSVKRWFQELIGAIRTWLRAHGFKGLGQFSDSEIMALLKRTREAATELKLEGGSVLRVLRDVAEPDATAKTDTAQAAYSLAGLPPSTRKIIGTDPVLAGWTLLAQNDEAFQLPVSERKSLEDIFSEVAPGIKIRRAPEFDNDGARVWAVNPKKDTLALVFQKGKSVWIDVADYSDGQGGRWIYNAAANYAHNTGKTFIGDPAGLSDKAMARRLENMISSALKFGTTEHLWPHERQEQGGAGVRPIKWKAGDDTHNLKEMIKASYEATLNQFPEIKDLRYNPITDQIEGVKDGKVYTRADIEKIAESKRAEAVTGEPPVTAGRATLERAVLTHSLLRGTRQEQFNVLAALSNQRSERLAGILYSLAPGNNQQTRPSGGFSVSGVMEKMGLGKDNRGASLPPSVRAAYDMLGGKDKTFAEKIKQKVKRQLAPGGLLPREIFDLKIARDAEMNSEDNQQRYILEDFYAQVVEVYHKPYTELRASTRKEIDDYLKGERTNVKLTDSMVKVLGRMRKHIQNLSAKYIDELLLDAASLEAKGKIAEADEKRRLINTITENFDTYLHRSYRAFDDPDWPKKVPEEVYQTAVDYLANQYAGNDPVNESHIREATKKVDLMLHEGTAHDSMARFIAESKLGSKDLSVLKKRKAIAPEIRALLGEYEDPAINYAKSVTKMSRLVSNTAFLRQMREASLALGLLYEEKDRPVGTHKKIAADASEVYSPLNGLYTYPEFEQALRDAVGSNKEPDWYKWIVTANAAVKYGKTVLAPTTAMRNIISASMFSLTSGHWNLAHLDKSLKAAKTYFTAQDVRGSREYINKLLKLGVLYDAPNYRELQDLIKQVNEGESVVAKAMRKSKAATVLNYAQEFYALGDDFWKILGFENEKAMLIKHFNMSEANAEREAAERIRNTYPTYSMTGRGIQTLRRFPLIGSFPSFPAEIIRTTYHKFRYFHQDAKALGYSNPAVLAKGVGLALGAGMMGAISALSAAMFGVDDDEEEAIRQMLPEWSRNANLLFLGRDDKGQIEYMDLTWLDPYSYWKKPLSALARDKDIDEKAGDAAWEALSPFLGVDIAFGAAIQFAKDIANSGVTRETATDKLGKSLAPGAVNNAIGFWNAAHDTVTKSGKKYSFEDEALALFGFRKGTLNAKVGLTYQAYGYQDKKREASTVLRDKATNLGKVDINELRDAYAQSMEMHKEAWDEMRRIVKLAQKVGMSKTEVVAALRTSGISLRDARLMAADEEFRYQPPKNMMKLAIKRASILFDKETQDELKARAKSLRELQNEFQAKPGRQ